MFTRPRTSFAPIFFFSFLYSSLGNNKMKDGGVMVVAIFNTAGIAKGISGGWYAVIYEQPHFNDVYFVILQALSSPVWTYQDCVPTRIHNTTR